MKTLGCKYVLLVIALAVQLVLADTEIRNFRFPLPPHPARQDIQDLNATVLSHKARQLRLTISDVQPERAILLDCNEAYSAWTARISWPGSTPTQFDLAVHAVPANLTRGSSPLTGGTNQALLVITARPLSPLISHPTPRNTLIHRLTDILRPSVPLDRQSQSRPQAGRWETPFELVLEPLIMGVLPRTALPTVWLILLFAAGAAVCVPSIIKALERAHAFPADKNR